MAPLKATLVLADWLSAVALFLLLANLRFEVLGGSWAVESVRPVQLALAYGVLWVASLWLLGLYRLRTHWALRGEIVDVLRATVVAFLAALSVLYLFDLTQVSRVFLVMLLIAQPAVTIGLRVVLRRVLERLRSRGELRRQMLIIGAGDEAEAFATRVEHQPELGLQVMGHLRGPHERRLAVSRPVIGRVDEIESVLHSRVVDEVAICLSPADWSYVEPITRICEEEGKIVRVSIQSLGGLLTGGHYEEVGGLPIVTFLYGPDRFLGMLAKRIFDVTASVVLLVLLSPVLFSIALYVRVTDGSPVLFRQRRIGLHGRPFTCLKYRTMVRDAEDRLTDVAHLSEVERPVFKIADDPRVTSTGRFLRRTSLDELPQLWNVLRGEMSIVGPRPALPSEVEQYSIWHRRRLSMRPGLTGLWQVTARSEADFDRRVALDLDYIDRWSLLMDVKILLRTIPVMLAQEGR
jgi:exopolysaccharide biosynthesis polyprenyl glycosylphosphotransferase